MASKKNGHGKEMTKETTKAVFEDFNPFDPRYGGADPYPYYKRMRDECPVFLAENAHDTTIVATHNLVLEVLRNPTTFSSQFSLPTSLEDSPVNREINRIMENGWERVSTLLTSDPPDHTRNRKLVSKAFTPKAISDLEPFLRSITNQLLDDIIEKRKIELVKDFAMPLPVLSIAAALGVPDAKIVDFRRWTEACVDQGSMLRSNERRIQATHEIVEMQHFFAKELQSRLEKPLDDILTGLVQASLQNDEIEKGETHPLTMPEMLSIIQQLLVAGNETTTKLITEMILLLARDQNELQKLHSHPERIPLIVEESLRLLSPTQGMYRMATCPSTVGKAKIEQGSRVLVSYASANRDERLFPKPDQFNPDRANLREHLAFGKGTHYCIGAALARLEATVALSEFSKRISTISLASDNEFDYSKNPLLRGLSHLYLEITPR